MSAKFVRGRGGTGPARSRRGADPPAARLSCVQSRRSPDIGGTPNGCSFHVDSECALFHCDDPDVQRPEADHQSIDARGQAVPEAPVGYAQGHVRVYELHHVSSDPHGKFCCQERRVPHWKRVCCGARPSSESAADAVEVVCGRALIALFDADGGQGGPSALSLQRSSSSSFRCSCSGATPRRAWSWSPRVLSRESTSSSCGPRRRLSRNLIVDVGAAVVAAAVTAPSVLGPRRRRHQPAAGPKRWAPMGSGAVCPEAAAPSSRTCAILLGIIDGPL